jgi:hypothetical protein
MLVPVHPCLTCLGMSELQRRCDTLIRLIERENTELRGKKVGAIEDAEADDEDLDGDDDGAGAGSAKKRKGDGASPVGVHTKWFAWRPHCNDLLNLIFISLPW